ncbi:glycosyltransferase family 4 protein [uncultured Psychrobacter sp.]|uniref:glycosyltransferase family 4 protein n=1 Tax=uncultured Psychrobacter sp. TaxID=259303 RepID=UPI0034587E1F
MKFLIIASFPPSLLSFRGALLTAIQNAGFKVHVAAPEFENYLEDKKKLETLGFVVHNIPMQRTGTDPIKDVKTLSALYRLMKNVKPDYVLGYTIKPVIYGTLAAWLARVPNRFALITGLGYAFQEMESADQRTRLQKLIHDLYRRALSKADKVFFQNPDDEKLFRQLNIVSKKSETCVVNGSGVDVAQYNVAPLTEQTTPKFLMIARLLWDKGVREYVQAAQQIKQTYPDAQFDLVGWIDTNPHAITQKELDDWVAEGTINFLGRLDDVRPAIGDSSVYVLPSYREGTPRTVLEAMAMGRAVITTDAPGCRETVVDGDNGFLIPVKDVDALTQAMLRFIEEPSLIIEMGKRAREVAEEKYDVHKVNEKMLSEMGL